MQNSSGSARRRDDSLNISAVILDYGQVLARSATREEFERMARMFDVPFEVFYALWETTRDTYDRGDVTPDEYWLHLAAQTNGSVDRGQIETLRSIEIEIWENLDQGMLDWVSELRSAGIKTGLLSNMPCDLVTHLRTHCKWMDDFAFKTFSSEVRLIKPDAAIYEHTLQGLGVSASEALFVDDREINIKAARALGIHAIQFQSIAQLRDDLKALGFPILPASVKSTSAVTDAANSAGSHQESKFSALLSALL
jgi:putative hydrolase of the HAD superfamily